MVEKVSAWIKGLGLAIVIVSILEMLLPNNKTKKYIRTVMGIYILFNIISPFINKQEMFNFNIEEYASVETSSKLNQTSIENLYIQELEKDITKKIEEKGFKVLNCEVDAIISNKEEETQINKIKMHVEKSEEKDNLENEIVVQIQKIKPVNTSIKEDFLQNNEKQEDNTKLNKIDLQNIKKFLIKEYGVNEKCLEIN